jgi:anti-sigma regulatory factor (Ser/Thr protein kinase)
VTAYGPIKGDTPGPWPLLARPLVGYGHLVAEPVLVASGEFRPEPAAVPAARRLVRDALARLPTGALGQDGVDILVLAANEVITNAVLHARTEFTVTVLLAGPVARVEVTDGNTRTPQPCLTPLDATSGRGLGLVDALGLMWGVERRRDGKVVRLESVVA